MDQYRLTYFISLERKACPINGACASSSTHSWAASHEPVAVVAAYAHVILYGTGEVGMHSQGCAVDLIYLILRVAVGQTRAGPPRALASEVTQ